MERSSPVFTQMEAKFSELRKLNESTKLDLLKHKLKSIKEPVSHLCLSGAVVASWSLRQEVANSNGYFYKKPSRDLQKMYN